MWKSQNYYQDKICGLKSALRKMKFIIFVHISGIDFLLMQIEH
jgi:hypothetical protein